MIDADHFLAGMRRGNISHAHLLIGEQEAARALVDRLANSLGISPFDRHVVEIAGESISGSVSIATIRELKAKLSLKPHSSSHHLVFFPVAPALTVEAQNALLKLLEEPAAPTVFFLTTPDEKLLLPTVVSRCQRVRLTGYPSVRADTQTLSQILDQSLAEQFSLAESLAKDDELPKVLDGWTLELRSRLQAGDPAASRALQGILATKERVTQTQVNKRLLLEDLFLALRYPEMVPSLRLQESWELQ